MDLDMSQVARAQRHGMVTEDSIADLWSQIGFARLKNGDDKGAIRAWNNSLWNNPVWRKGKAE